MSHERENDHWKRDRSISVFIKDTKLPDNVCVFENGMEDNLPIDDLPETPDENV